MNRFSFYRGVTYVRYSSLLILIILFSGLTFGQSGKVYVAYIESEIDLGMVPYIKRTISEAEKAHADAIIFKINTFGGRLDAATQIKDAIISSNLLTIALIDHRAISAGSYIALSCKKIAMVPGATIGAATVVNQKGQKMSEKYQAFMRSEMRTVAETNGRPVNIAQGMVDERIVIPGLVDSTELISLTTDEAIKYHIADTVVTNLAGVLAAFHLNGDKMIKVKSNWSEDAVAFLQNPVVSSILIIAGLIGLFIEIKTPGFGFGGLIAVVSFALFFGSSYILQMSSSLEIIMFIVGVVLLILEIFVIPGFGITGVAGIILIIASIFMALVGGIPFFDLQLMSPAIVQLSVSLLLTLLSVFYLAKFLPKSKHFSKLILAEKEDASEGFVSRPSGGDLLGAVGIALTTLRPAGTAVIKDKKVDVVSESEYVQQGSKIKVIRVEGIKIVVRPLKN